MMKAAFEPAYQYTLENEGTEFTDTPDDLGGPTKFGISIHTYSTYLNSKATALDVQKMTDVQARAVYKKLFWDALRLGLLSEQTIATAIFDVNVNMGQQEAIDLTLLALNALGYKIPTSQVWTNALTILEMVNVQNFMIQFHQQVRNHYNDIVAKNESQAKFIKGWFARADRLLTLDA